MAGHGRKNVDAVLVEALACGASAANAAQRAGVSARTVFRRLEEPAFRQRIEKVKQETVERTSAMLTAMGIESCRGLHDLMDKSIPPHVRLGVFRAVLGLGCTLREHVDLGRRVSELEEERDRSKTAPPDEGSRTSRNTD